MTSFHRKSTVGHIACDSGACACVCAVSYFNGCNEIGVAADECIVADSCAVFFLAVIINGDNAAAEVYSASHIAVTHISEVRHSGILTDNGVLDLNEIAYLNAPANPASGTYLNERTYLNIILDNAVISLNGVENGAVADLAVFDYAVGTDNAVFADDGVSSQDNSLKDSCAPAHLNVSADSNAVGAGKFHAVIHQPVYYSKSCRIIQ